MKLAELPIREREARRALAGTLQGAGALDPSWLPAAGVVGDAIAAERAEHLRLLDGLRAAVDGYRQAVACFHAEDREHTAALRSHARDGGDPPADDRTVQADREARLAALVERVEAAVVVLAEHVDRVVAVLREREDELIGGSIAKLPAVAAKREEAERVLAEARREEWTLLIEARWVKSTADDSAFARVPAPDGSEVPPPGWPGGLTPADLERRWHQRQPWAEVDDLAQDALARVASDSDGGDPTGQVSELVEGAAA